MIKIPAIPRQPDPYIQLQTDQELIKLGHLKYVIDQINEQLSIGKIPIVTSSSIVETPTDSSYGNAYILSGVLYIKLSNGSSIAVSGGALTGTPNTVVFFDTAGNATSSTNVVWIESLKVFFAGDSASGSGIIYDPVNGIYRLGEFALNDFLIDVGSKLAAIQAHGSDLLKLDKTNGVNTFEIANFKINTIDWKFPVGQASTNSLLVVDPVGNIGYQANPYDSAAVYNVLLSQSGTGAPTVDKTIQDTIGSPVIAYVGDGIYTITKTGAFPTQSKVILTISGSKNTGTMPSDWAITWTDANTITITTVDVIGGVPANNILSFSNVSITVLP